MAGQRTRRAVDRADPFVRDHRIDHRRDRPGVSSAVRGLYGVVAEHGAACAAERIRDPGMAVGLSRAVDRTAERAAGHDLSVDERRLSAGIPAAGWRNSGRPVFHQQYRCGCRCACGDLSAVALDRHAGCGHGGGRDQSAGRHGGLAGRGIGSGHGGRDCAPAVQRCCTERSGCAGGGWPLEPVPDLDAGGCGDYRRQLFRVRGGLDPAVESSAWHHRAFVRTDADRVHPRSCVRWTVGSQAQPQHQGSGGGGRRRAGADGSGRIGFAAGVRPELPVGGLVHGGSSRETRPAITSSVWAAPPLRCW